MTFLGSRLTSKTDLLFSLSWLALSQDDHFKSVLHQSCRTLCLVRHPLRVELQRLQRQQILNQRLLSASKWRTRKYSTGAKTLPVPGADGAVVFRTVVTTTRWCASEVRQALRHRRCPTRKSPWTCHRLGCHRIWRMSGVSQRIRCSRLAYNRRCRCPRCEYCDLIWRWSVCGS